MKEPAKQVDEDDEYHDRATGKGKTHHPVCRDKRDLA